MDEYFKNIFINQTPLIDVRAPVEFNEGHFPSSINLPIMSNEDRHQVGIEYRNKGKEAAIALGHQLVSEEIKTLRVKAWAEFISKNSTAKLYCFRGGLRSQIATQWIKDAGLPIERIAGGYKALRHYLLENLETQSVNCSFYVLSGLTGVGKTPFLYKKGIAEKKIDLERLANHKGSSFGSLGAQPAQATFENTLSIEFLKLNAPTSILLEDESRRIGLLHVPRTLFLRMSTAPVIVLCKTTEERAHAIIQEYVLDKTAYYLGDAQKTKEFLIGSVQRIEKRLGGLKAKSITLLILSAFEAESADPFSTHHEWVSELLKHYYDPRYEYAIKQKAERIVFQGSEADCLDFLKHK